MGLAENFYDWGGVKKFRIKRYSFRGFFWLKGSVPYYMPWTIKKFSFIKPVLLLGNFLSLRIFRYGNFRGVLFSVQIFQKVFSWRENVLMINRMVSIYIIIKTEYKVQRLFDFAYFVFQLFWKGVLEHFHP